MSITAVLVVRNEAHRIANSLKRIRPYVNHIIVADQDSDDGTTAILHQMWLDGVVSMLVHEDAHGYCEASRQTVMGLVTDDWTLVLDADEEITTELANILPTIDQVHHVDGFYLLHETFFDGKHFCVHSHYRLFRTGTATHLPVIHSEPLPNDPQRTRSTKYVGIRSYKTRAEQTLDDERYKKLMGDAYPA
jgi:glycosyltransferase involved in cell wall biosynthesis